MPGISTTEPENISGIGRLKRRGAPQDLHALVQEQDDAEGRDHLVEMVAVVEMAEDREFEQQPEHQRGAEREHEREEEIAGEGVEHHGEIGAEHVLDAVREIDEVHHAEHQREAGRDEEQQHAELQPVQRLDDEEGGGHHRCPSPRPAKRGEGAERAKRSEAGEGLVISVKAPLPART